MSTSHRNVLLSAGAIATALLALLALQPFIPASSVRQHHLEQAQTALLNKAEVEMGIGVGPLFQCYEDACLVQRGGYLHGLESQRPKECLSTNQAFTEACLLAVSDRKAVSEYSRFIGPIRISIPRWRPAYWILP